MTRTADVVLQDWYKGSALWLSRKGGPTYRVDAAFLW